MYDFLLVVYSNFCRITHRFWEMWCETVQWPWNMPKVIDSRITWKLSCGHVCKMFGRQWTNEAKIAIFNWRPLSSETPNIYINLILPETTFPGLHFCRWQYMGSSANVRTVLSESRCDDSEDIASERSENLYFRPPHSPLTPPLQRTPANICIKLILLETRIPGLHFCRW